MFAALVEQLKLTGLGAAPSDQSFAGPEDVACDICTGRKLKAIKSCLVCLVSYCEKHLQPHYDVARLKKHQLVEPSKQFLENICSHHDELMKMFCRTDQQSICYVCTVDEHKGHDVVSAAAERKEKQKEMKVKRGEIQQRINDREKNVKLLQQEVKAINISADKAEEDNEKIFTDVIRLIQKRSSELKQQIRSQQKSEVIRVKDLQEKLEQEIYELKKKDAELEQLEHTEDHNQFLQEYPSLSAVSKSKHSPSINVRPLRYFEDVIAAVSELREKMQNVLEEGWTKISLRVTEVDVLLSEPEQKRGVFSVAGRAKVQRSSASAENLEFFFSLTGQERMTRSNENVNLPTGVPMYRSFKKKKRKCKKYPILACMSEDLNALDKAIKALEHS